MIKNKIIILSAFVMMITSYANARDQIKIVGSSTVYPYTTVVAERFGKQGKFKTPVVESTGTGGGFKSFCGGVGVQHPDMTGKQIAFLNPIHNNTFNITSITEGFYIVNKTHKYNTCANSYLAT